MLTSRGLNLLRLTSRFVQKESKTLNLQPIRLGHAVPTYRHGPKPPRINVIAAEILGGFFWWWILWHFYHDIGHVIGEFPYPDPSKWTDEELGIPPDDVD